MLQQLINSTMVIGASNPFVSKFNTLVNDGKTWLLGIDMGLTLLIIVWHAVKYKQGNRSEKQEALDDIKKTAYWGIGIFAVIWVVTYAIGVFSA